MGFVMDRELGKEIMAYERVERITVEMTVRFTVSTELWDADYGTGNDSSTIADDVALMTKTALDCVIDKTDAAGSVEVGLDDWKMVQR